MKFIFGMNPTHKNNCVNSRSEAIQSKQERIEQFEFNIVVVNQNSSMISAKISFAQAKWEYRFHTKQSRSFKIGVEQSCIPDLEDYIT